MSSVVTPRIYMMHGVIFLKAARRTFLTPIAVLILCCLLFLMLSYISCSRIAESASAMTGAQTRVIVVDAGHGGEDGGATGKSGVPEKTINLAIARNLSEFLTASGFRVVMTRTDDVSTADANLSTVRERKVSDLHNRLKLVTEQGDCIFVSIHQNHFTQSRYNGTQVFYSGNNSDSKILAENIRSRVVSLLQKDNTRETKPATSSIYLLWQAKVPAVLVECGFLSNEAEEAKLNDPIYQKQMAFAVYCGLLDYCNPQGGL